MDYPNSGSLWPPKSRTHENSPNVTGSIKLDRAMLKSLLSSSDEPLIEVRLSGWTKEWQGKKYLSLKASPPNEEYASKKKAPVDDDSDVPF